MTSRVVIVGGGNAGLAAAATAGELGLETVVVEKTDRLGGQLHWSSGHFSGAGTRLQASHGIDDTAAEHAADIMRIGHGRGTPHVVELAAAEAGPAIDWLDDLGFAFSPESPSLVSGHELYSKPRTYWGGTDSRRGGLPILETLAKAVDACPTVTVRYGRAIVDVVLDGGRCTGVVLDSGERIEAGLTVLATGGYAASRTLVADLQPAYASALTGCLPHATGDGLTILLRHGAEIVAADTYVPTMGMIPDPDTEGFGIPLHTARLIVNAAERPPWEVWVDLDGRRFVDETTPSPFVREQALLRAPGLAMAAVWDQAIFEAAPPAIGPDWTRDRMLAEADRGRWLHRADTLQDLAALVGVDPEGLAETVAEWNAGGDAFGRSHRPLPISRPPYWGVRSVGGMLLSRGGPRVDAELRPILHGRAVHDIRCVGEILGMGQFSGDSFASGMSVGPAISLGRWVVRSWAAGRLAEARARDGQSDRGRLGDSS